MQSEIFGGLVVSAWFCCHHFSSWLWCLNRSQCLPVQIFFFFCFIFRTVFYTFRLVYSCTWFNADFHVNFVSLGIAHAKNQSDAIQYSSRFHQIIVYIFCFCFNNGLRQKPVATKSSSSFSFCLTYSLSHLSYLCGALDVCFFSVLLPFFSWLFRSLNFAEKNGYLSRFRCGFFFLLFVWNYWLHNGPVKIKVNCTPRKEYDKKHSISSKKKCSAWF